MTNHKVRGERGTGNLKLFVDGKELSLAKSLAVINHSPDGFNAGYGGYGPSQSALAILLAVTTKNDAEKYHQKFKWDFIAKEDLLNSPDFEFEFDYEAWAKTITVAGPCTRCGHETGAMFKDGETWVHEDPLTCVHNLTSRIELLESGREIPSATPTQHPGNVIPANLNTGDRLGFKIIAVIGGMGDWAAYAGPTNWSDDKVSKVGDKISKEAAEELFYAPRAADLKYRSH
jgi:hypothetical protein